MDSKNKRLRVDIGELEKAGLSEVTYFIKKAEKNIDYAMYSLDNTEFSAAVARLKVVSTKLKDMRKLGNDMLADIDNAFLSIYDNIKESEIKKEEEENVQKNRQSDKLRNPKL